ncbi:MAG: TolC family protein [Proteobacteria bacterium]|nr:TolC family protein [Pseudomonadota bacterium]
MSLVKITNFLAVFLFLGAISEAQVLTEKKVIELHRAQSLQNQSLLAQKSAADLSSNLLDESFSARLEGQVNYAHSGEKPTNAFQPVISPAEDWTLSVEKRLRRGVGLSAGVFGSKTSASDNSFTEATQVGARAQVSLDLWKNFLGRIDQNQTLSQESQKKRAELEYQVNLRKSELEMRKVFWSLVAVDQSIDLSKQLLASANEQLQDAMKRQSAGVADRGEVARYRSQVDSRNSSLLLFQYERALFLQAFEKSWKDFQSAGWTVDLKESDTQLPRVQQCIAAISSHAGTPLEGSSFDEMVQLMNDELSAELKIAETHSDLDVQLLAQAQTSGVSDSYSKARRDLSEENRAGYGVGLLVTVPLGSSSKESEKSLLAVKKNSLQAQKSSLQKELDSTHSTMVKALELLSLGLKNQIQNSQNLRVNYQEVQRKFQQGRIPVSNVIFEQDALFQSQLQEISFKKQLAHAVLDYFQVFDQFKCSWNQQ